MTMTNYDAQPKSSTPTSPLRWRPDPAGLFGRPALTRRQILDRRPVEDRSDADVAYLEAHDLLSAYPGQLQAIYQGLTDAALEAQEDIS